MKGTTMIISEAARNRLGAIRHVALDMDGTIYLGERLFPETAPFLGHLGKLGIGYTFLTNNSSKSRDAYLQKLAAMGLEITPQHVLTSTHGLINYLQRELPAVRRLFALGTPSFHNELGLYGYHSCEDEPDAVVVGFDTTISYERLCCAAWWISQGRPFIATHPDLVCPTDRPTVMVDCGAICKTLEAATGVAPEVIGKPSPRMLDPIFHEAGVSAWQTAVVGDRLMTDMELARRSGALGVMVLTGEATLEDVEALPEAQRPDMVLSHLGLLSDLFAEPKRGSLS